MSSAEAALRRAWHRWLPGEPDAVVGRYREPWRRYHGVAHVASVVREVQQLLAVVDVADPATVVAAAFLHDAVYHPRSSTNEADSAALVGVVLADWEPARRAEVARLVLSTAAHHAADAAAAVLSDADLAVLGAEPAAYQAYARAVRAEYAHVDEEGWRKGRADVLRSLLARSPIYLTAPMAAREARARANLTAELASLGAAP